LATFLAANLKMPSNQASPFCRRSSF
jgi:hypothetical protein